MSNTILTIALDAHLATCTIRELKAFAKEHKVPNYSRLAKAALLQAIRAHLAAPEPISEPMPAPAQPISAPAPAPAPAQPISAQSIEAGFRPDYVPVELSQALAWGKFTATATASTARAIAHAPETKTILHGLYTLLCVAIAAAIYAGIIAGRAWRSDTAKTIRYRFERWFTGQVLESLGTQPHPVLPLVPYDHGNNLSDLARSALS